MPSAFLSSDTDFYQSPYLLGLLTQEAESCQTGRGPEDTSLSVSLAKMCVWTGSASSISVSRYNTTNPRMFLLAFGFDTDTHHICCSQALLQHSERFQIIHTKHCIAVDVNYIPSFPIRFRTKLNSELMLRAASESAAADESYLD